MKFATEEETLATAQKIIDTAVDLGYTIDKEVKSPSTHGLTWKDDDGEEVIRMKVTQKKIDFYHGARDADGEKISHRTYRITSEYKSREALEALTAPYELRTYNCP